MPDEGSTGWDDAIKGRIEVPNAELEDLVLVRSDGRPTYNFASPLEDWLDGITHVIRGDDHVSNTPKQIHVLRALGAEPPVYAHVPSVFGADGTKLSKRHGAVSVDEFRAAGYVPEALMNFLALLGWAPDGETTIMSPGRARRALLARARRLEPGDVRLREARLDERRLPARVAAGRVRGAAGRVPARVRASTGRRSASAQSAPLVQEKIGTLASIPGFAGFLFHEVEPDPALLDARILGAAERALEAVEPWAAAQIEQALKELCEELGEKPRTVYLPIRVAVTGSRVSPGLYESLELLGKETSLARLRAGLEAGRVTALGDLVGHELGPSSWLELTQERIDAFAEATDDPPVDPHGCGPGAPPRPVRDDDRARLPDAVAVRADAVRALPARRGRMAINYGVDRVRFPAPVPSGARIRGSDDGVVRRGNARRESVARSTSTVECDGVGEARLRGRSRRADSVLTTPGASRHVCYLGPPVGLKRLLLLAVLAAAVAASASSPTPPPGASTTRTHARSSAGDSVCPVGTDGQPYSIRVPRGRGADLRSRRRQVVREERFGSAGPDARPTDGTLSGTPTQAGTYAFWFELGCPTTSTPNRPRVGLQQQATTRRSIVIDHDRSVALRSSRIGPESTTPGTTGTPYSLQMTSSVADPKTWTITRARCPRASRSTPRRASSPARRALPVSTRSRCARR